MRLVARYRAALLAGALGAALGTAAAAPPEDGFVERAGERIPTVLEPAGLEAPLRLNGVGVFSKFIFDIYVAALYLPEPSRSPEAIISANDRPRRLELRFVYRRIDGDRFIRRFRDHVEESLDGEYRRVMMEAVASSRDLQLFGTDIVAGDVIAYQYRPGRGTRIEYNGEQVAHVEDPTYFEALLAMWIGEKAPDKGLKAALLGID